MVKRRLGALTALVTAVAGIGLAVPGTASADPQPSGSQTGAAQNAVFILKGDNGETFTVHRGQPVVAALTPTPGDGTTLVWSQPQSTPTDVLHPVIGGTTDRGDGWELFAPTQIGAATITADESCRPQPGHVCTMMVIQWKVTVNVVD